MVSNLKAYGAGYTNFSFRYFLMFRINILQMLILEKEMATYSSILAWEISWTEEGLQSMGLQSWTRLSTHIQVPI